MNIKTLKIIKKNNYYWLIFTYFSIFAATFSKTVTEFFNNNIFLNFLLLFNYSCLPFLPIPPPHPSQTHLPPPPPPSPYNIIFKYMVLLLLILKIKSPQFSLNLHYMINILNPLKKTEPPL